MIREGCVHPDDALTISLPEVGSSELLEVASFLYGARKEEEEGVENDCSLSTEVVRLLGLGSWACGETEAADSARRRPQPRNTEPHVVVKEEPEGFVDYSDQRYEDEEDEDYDWTKEFGYYDDEAEEEEDDEADEEYGVKREIKSEAGRKKCSRCQRTYRSAVALKSHKCKGKRLV